MKKIAVLGTGTVGKTIATKCVSLGYEVKLGSRSSENATGIAWAAAHGQNASFGSYAEAAAAGEIIFNCTKGMASTEALQLAGRENLQNKIIIDLANPLDFSKGMPPSLSICNTDSLAEQIQRQFTDSHVVKALNTLNSEIMVNPSLLAKQGVLFVCGNDADAKQEVKLLLEHFGWNRIIDLGDISAARATEQLLPVWIRLMGSLGTTRFNFDIVQ